MNSKEEAFVTLVRLGIGHSAGELPQNVDWTQIQALAKKQRLDAIVLDGVVRLPESKRPPKEALLEWIGQVVQGYEYRFELYRRTIADMANFYNSNGYNMMLLKGYACAIDWPKPNHRPCGDIDIWLFGRQEEADALLAKEKGIKIDKSHNHHTVFEWNGFMVENHYDFLNVYHHRSNKEFEKVFKELGNDDSHYVDVDGERVYLPSPNLHSLFLLKHSMAHFAAEGIALRHLLDWGFHVKAYTNEIDWPWLEGVLGQYDMLDLYMIFNAICVGDLGFARDIFPEADCDSAMKERVLLDILSLEFGTEMPKDLVRRVAYKYRRWHGNEWKHKLCYRDSMASAFLSGVWNHLRKPATI